MRRKRVAWIGAAITLVFACAWVFSTFRGYVVDTGPTYSSRRAQAKMHYRIGVCQGAFIVCPNLYMYAGPWFDGSIAVLPDIGRSDRGHWWIRFPLWIPLVLAAVPTGLAFTRARVGSGYRPLPSLGSGEQSVRPERSGRFLIVVGCVLLALLVGCKLMSLNSERMFRLTYEEAESIRKSLDRDKLVVWSDMPDGSRVYSQVPRPETEERLRKIGPWLDWLACEGGSWSESFVDSVRKGAGVSHQASIAVLRREVYGRRDLWIDFFLMASCLMLGVCLICRVYRSHLIKRYRDAGFCVACGYNLKGNVSGVCSECGVSLRPGPPERSIQ